MADIRQTFAILILSLFAAGCFTKGSPSAEANEAVEARANASALVSKAASDVRDPRCKRLKGGLLHIREWCPPEWGEDVFGHVMAFESTLHTQAAYRDCFSSLGDSGSSSSLPPKSAKCFLGPSKRCEPVPAGEADEPWEYVLPEDDVWGLLELHPEAWAWADSLYKTIHWQRTGDTCIVEIQAWGDLNQDGVLARYSTGLTFPVGTGDMWPLESAWFYEQPGFDKNIEGMRPVLADWISVSK